MMKKLVLGIAVCCGGSGVACEHANGMNTVEAIVSDIAKDPFSEGKLTELVAKLVDQKNGLDNSLTASICVLHSKVSSKNQDDFSKICCMIDVVLRDWLTKDRADSLTYYVDGARTGRFGPFSF